MDLWEKHVFLIHWHQIGDHTFSTCKKILILGKNLKILSLKKKKKKKPLVTALLTIAKTWKQPKCPSTDEWIKKIWYTYTMEYYSIIKKNEMTFAATWMELKIIILSEVSQEEKTDTI